MRDYHRAFGMQARGRGQGLETLGSGVRPFRRGLNPPPKECMGPADQQPLRRRIVVRRDRGRDCSRRRAGHSGHAGPAMPEEQCRKRAAIDDRRGEDHDFDSVSACLRPHRGHAPSAEDGVRPSAPRASRSRRRCWGEPGPGCARLPFISRHILAATSSISSTVGRRAEAMQAPTTGAIRRLRRSGCDEGDFGTRCTPAPTVRGCSDDTACTSASFLIGLSIYIVSR